MFVKRLAAGLAAMATLAAGLAGPSAYAAGVSFRDVTSSTPHADDIRWASSVGITTGWRESDGSYTFRGMDTVKRQDMAAFLRREATLMKVSDASTWKPSTDDWRSFRDVTSSTPHAEDVLWLAHSGITTGWNESDGTRTFRGMDSVKRQDMAAFLHRLARLASRGTDVNPKSFRDVTSSTPHADDIRWLGGSGVSTGYADCTYRGMVSVYRQDMAAFLHRLDQLKPDTPAAPVQQVVTANGSSFAVRSDGSLWAWGGDHHTPVKLMDDVSTVSAFSGNNASIFAVKKDGSLWAWGDNWAGQLGVGDRNYRGTPTYVMDDVSTINANDYGEFAFAVKKDGSLWAWGRNDCGQLGVGDKKEHLTPAYVTDNISAITAGGISAFAVKKDGSLWAWGDNSDGQLGVGDKKEHLTPAYVTDNISTAVDTAYDYIVSGGFGGGGSAGIASGSYTFAVKKDGSLWAWGGNHYGQLGVGDKKEHLTPAYVTDNISAITGSDGSAFAVKKDGSLWAWGDNSDGQLGVGNKKEHLTPTYVTDNISAITGSDGSAFAVKKDGSLWAWGDNWAGQLGVGDTDNRLSPVKVM